MKNTTKATCFITFTVGLFSFAASASATIYDANADFSGGSNPNPNGLWSQGYTLTLGSAFQLFDLFDPNLNGTGISIWTSSVIGGTEPHFLKNNGETTDHSVESGQIAMHPGPSNEYAVLRFTIPTTGDFTIDAQFLEGDLGVTDARILLNGNTVTPVFYAVTTDGSPTFLATLGLQTGDTVDFVVGAVDEYYGDSTPIQVTITPAPEPTSAALVLGGGALLALRRRRSPDGV